MAKKRASRKRVSGDAAITRMTPGTIVSAAPDGAVPGEYGRLITNISGLLEQARRGVARSANAILTATYWEIGRRIVEHEQGGKERAEYGEALLVSLAKDLTARFGRGFSRQGLQRMRSFYLDWEIHATSSHKFEARVKLPADVLEAMGKICSTPLSKLESEAKCSTPLSESEVVQTLPTGLSPALISAFPLSWSHYIWLMSVDRPHARAFYEAEAIRGGWSVRQLDRQISTQFFERTAASKNPDALLARNRQAKPEDAVSVEDEVRNPYLLEFLGLKDEYSESELEEALVRHLESFLLELGAGFTFVARQKRIRVGEEWYRIDLLLFHRRLKCLVAVDLKLGKFTHADAGQMNLYLNYLREHAMEPDENEPVGIILCSAKSDAVVHYAMGGIKAQVFASRYMTTLPDPETLRQEIIATQHDLESQAAMKRKDRG